jgi:chromosome segregation ATPase
MEFYRYLTSNLDLEYELCGISIPKKTYTREQLQAGKRIVLPLTKEQYDKLAENKMFDAMITKGSWHISETRPADKTTNSDYARENAVAVRELEQVKKDFADVKQKFEERKRLAHDAESKLAGMVEEIKGAAKQLLERDKKIEELESEVRRLRGKKGKADAE